MTHRRITESIVGAQQQINQGAKAAKDTPLTDRRHSHRARAGHQNQQA